MIRLSTLALVSILIGCSGTNQSPKQEPGPDAPGSAQKTAAASPQKLAGSRPNILFIFSDDHAAHAISAYGSKINETPNIDRLAKEGMLFRNVFCGNSICGPSRATILTGKHTHVHGFMRNGNKFDGSQVTFPKLLRMAGYTTAMIGKWHLTSDPTGFDYWKIFPGQGQYYNPDLLSKDGKERIHGYATEITTKLAVDWLEKGRDKSKPFLLMCQHKAPHRSWMPGPNELDMYADTVFPEPEDLFDDYKGRGPAAATQEMEVDRHMTMYYDLKLVPTAEEAKSLRGPDRWWMSMRKRLDAKQLAAWDRVFEKDDAAYRHLQPKGKDLVRWKYQRYMRDYLRCVAGVDKSVGQLLDYVDKDEKLRKNTIVIYSADQGFYLGDHGWFDKRWMYEESLRMPFLVRWPDHVRPSTECLELGQNIDFAPTFLELAGASIPKAIQGKSLVPLLEGRKPESWRDAIYYHYYESHAVHMVPAHYGVRTARYKLIYYYEPENRYWELFDLVKDPGEHRSVSDDPAYAEIRARLTKRLTELRKQYKDETGDLRDGSFTVTAGIASIRKKDKGLEVRANAWGGYALKRCEEPIRLGKKGVTTILVDVKPITGKDRSEAFVLLSSGKPRQGIWRAGIDFKKGELRIYGGSIRKPTSKLRIRVDSSKPVKLRIRIDRGRRRLSVRGAGAKISAEIAANLPRSWKSIEWMGYGLSDCKSWFSELRRED